MLVLRLSGAEARRIAVQAQLLSADRPTDLLETVRHLTFLQVDPTAAIAPAADFVAWSRLGSGFQPAHLKRALEQDRTLFELDALVRPMNDLGLYLAGAGVVAGPRVGRASGALVGRTCPPAPRAAVTPTRLRRGRRESR